MKNSLCWCFLLYYTRRTGPIKKAKRAFSKPAVLISFYSLTHPLSPAPPLLSSLSPTHTHTNSQIHALFFSTQPLPHSLSHQNTDTHQLALSFIHILSHPQILFLFTKPFLHTDTPSPSDAFSLCLSHGHRNPAPKNQAHVHTWTFPPRRKGTGSFIEQNVTTPFAEEIATKCLMSYQRQRLHINMQWRGCAKTYLHCRVTALFPYCRIFHLENKETALKASSLHCSKELVKWGFGAFFHC